MTKALGEVQAGLSVRSDDRETVADYLSRWLDASAAQRVRPRTLAGYRLIVDKQVTPRPSGAFRCHGAASLLLAQGVHPRVVMEMLGPSTITLTMNVYSHVIPGLQRAAGTRMEAALG